MLFRSERKAYEIELEASRTILDNVFEMATKMAGRLDETRDITLKYFEGQVRAAVSLAVGFIEDIEARRVRGELSDEEARRLTYESLRSLQYGNNDYVWVSDYSANILSHPDPRYHGRNVSAFKDETGEGIIPRVIEIARRDGEGSYIYDWTRLGSGRTTRKIAYFRDLPKLKIVVGSGAYLDDIDAEVERRRVAAIDDMRKALREIRIARTGYAYIFDAADNMIIHPNANIEGQEFTTRRDPKTGQPIAEELKAVADTDHPLHYLWDKPSDPGNYVYEKISWVRHFKEFDWYIASSVYERRAPVLLAGARPPHPVGGGIDRPRRRGDRRPPRRRRSAGRSSRTGDRGSAGRCATRTPAPSRCRAPPPPAPRR